MIAFPIIQSLRVDNFQMYPGEPLGSGLDFSFPAGLTLIVGTNGLGKTTLISILYSMLAGPSEIRGLTDRVTLGNLPIEAKPLEPRKRGLFANRVEDAAVEARATLTFNLARRTVKIERSLADLRLLSFRIGSVSQESDDLEDMYQSLIPSLVGVASFGDWLLMLNTLVFYFETRRQLVWDPSAQVQVLRLLFLTPEESGFITPLGREILALDSDIRNATYVLGRRQKELDNLANKVITAHDVRAELSTLETFESADRNSLDNIDNSMASLESDRESSRRQLLNLQQDRDLKYRELERTKMLAIGQALPSASENARYILAQLVTGGSCLACGQIAETAMIEYTKRISKRHCLVCDSDLSSQVHDVVDIGSKQIAKTESAIERLDVTIAAEESKLLALSQDIQAREMQQAELRKRSLDRSVKIARLERLLPPAAASERSQFSVLRALRDDLAVRSAKLATMREEYGNHLKPIVETLQKHANDIKAEFEGFARDFLYEDIRLDWAPYRSSLGESGPTFDFPAFALDMGSGTFTSPVRRSSPNQVSESQREFIDLAFRMALISVAGKSGGSLVIDAPESSLDTVFVKRAASVLSRFAQTKFNRLVITSNLIDGDLLPSLITANARGNDGLKVYDLFALAAPTAATAALASDYKLARRRLLKMPKGRSLG